MAPHKDRSTKTTSPRMGLLEKLTQFRTGTAQELKRRTSMIALNVGLPSSIKTPMRHLVGPTGTARIGQTKTPPTMAAMGGTEAGAKTGVEGGRPRNGLKGDQ